MLFKESTKRRLRKSRECCVLTSICDDCVLVVRCQCHTRWLPELGLGSINPLKALVVSRPIFVLVPPFIAWIARRAGNQSSLTGGHVKPSDDMRASVGHDQKRTVARHGHAPEIENIFDDKSLVIRKRMREESRAGLLSTARATGKRQCPKLESGKREGGIGHTLRHIKCCFRTSTVEYIGANPGQETGHSVRVGSHFVPSVAHTARIGRAPP